MVHFKQPAAVRLFGLLERSPDIQRLELAYNPDAQKKWYCCMHGPQGMVDLEASSLDSMVIQLQFEIGRQRKANK